MHRRMIAGFQRLRREVHASFFKLIRAVGDWLIRSRGAIHPCMRTIVLCFQSEINGLWKCAVTVHLVSELRRPSQSYLYSCWLILVRLQKQLGCARYLSAWRGLLNIFYPTLLVPTTRTDSGGRSWSNFFWSPLVLRLVTSLIPISRVSSWRGIPWLVAQYFSEFN